MKKAVFLLVLLLAGCAPVVELPQPTPDPGPLAGVTVAVDAGHGGPDGGCSGNGLSEAELNLALAELLAEELESRGAGVVMTRTGPEVTLAEGSGTRKSRDMAYRAGLIARSRANLTLSIHMNAYGDGSVCGAQVFCQKKDETGRELAGMIQSQLNRLPEQTRPRSVQSGDYYILRVPPATGALVECGFLSNAREAALLSDPDYQRRLARAIALGIETFFT